jgi:hypothetical protein
MNHDDSLTPDQPLHERQGQLWQKFEPKLETVVFYFYDLSDRSPSILFQIPSPFGCSKSNMFRGLVLTLA